MLLFLKIPTIAIAIFFVISLAYLFGKKGDPPHPIITPNAEVMKMKQGLLSVAQSFSLSLMELPKL